MSHLSGHAKKKKKKFTYFLILTGEQAIPILTIDAKVQKASSLSTRC